MKKYLSLMILFLLTACGAKLTPITTCEKVGNIEPICRFTNPEDMESLPDNKTLLISQMGNMEGSKSGNLVAFDTTTQTITTLFPLLATNPASNNATENWGAKNCPGLPGAEFSPHGISFKQRDDGRFQLAIVNHGGRESVEMFEVLNTNDQYALEWRGCVVPTDGIYMNDVALMHNGGFVASHMFDKHAPKVFGMSTGIWKSQMGMDTGYVFEWLPTASETFRVLAESHGPFINGIQLSADDKIVFANVYAGSEIRKLDRASGKKLGSAHVVQTDNIGWDHHGFLLGASHTGKKLDQMDCMKHPGETCGFGFTIVRINPETMATENIFEHEGAPMGAATIAQEIGDSLYIGSFSGNRIIKIPYAR